MFRERRDISDNEIIQMDYSVRKDYFEKLIRQANYYRYDEIDLPIAEKKLRFAVRMITRDATRLTISVRFYINKINLPIRSNF